MENLQKLVGKTIKKIYFNEKYLKFETDNGNFCFTTEGDCCSESVFYDFYGVKDILGKKIKEIKEVELTTDDRMDGKKYQESIAVYGYQIFWEDEGWGDRTAVFSFRNYSNGYYGGSLEDCKDTEVLPEIKDDVIKTENNE